MLWLWLMMIFFNFFDDLFLFELLCIVDSWRYLEQQIAPNYPRNEDPVWENFKGMLLNCSSFETLGSEVCRQCQAHVSSLLVIGTSKNLADDADATHQELTTEVHTPRKRTARVLESDQFSTRYGGGSSWAKSLMSQPDKKPKSFWTRKDLAL